ncbi:hypothetical protein ASPZODRAFT_127154 [Penicilliopsis zonata CBS 506.65]|uniref:DNA-directed RNA polymerase III subunit Rpc5 n=1 Tax=Penicilliopsis zonata CBS 506.65 TaxID=1073090 RepID=A0A1L9SV95_9EURO|nr:hypothetical protein ASPZODRAFT_127154 [Penicilliopsis zonata CBS 506.65]OJJ51135.1 hypothetical protein ASPZODRAFT_127154 [Penicilliopsis zonata CBS 506.65]
MAESDPIISSYDVFLTDSEINRYVLQYLDRPIDKGYDERHGQQPAAFRMKPETGLVEVDVPINTQFNYDVDKGEQYGEALRRSRAAREGGGYGMAGGFSSVGAGASARVKMEGSSGDVEMGGTNRKEYLGLQTLGGRIKIPEEGDPVYMLAAFRGKNLHLSPVSAVVQLHPQLHHIDALEEMSKGRGSKGKKDGDEERSAETEARAIDVKIKAAEDGEAVTAGNLELLKQMQDEKWKTYDWVDAETEESWHTYESYMIHQHPEDLPQLHAAINSEDYLDTMSAPRIDPARPEMTGWAMKQNRKRQKEGKESPEDDAQG